MAVADAAGGRALTYRNLDALVTDLTAQLNRHGVGKGDSVAIASDNCLEYVLALFAVVRVRASAAPLDPAPTAPQMASTLSNLRARATIVPAHLHDEFVTTHDTVTSSPDLASFEGTSPEDELEKGMQPGLHDSRPLPDCAARRARVVGQHR